MKTGKKIAISVGAVVALGAIVLISVYEVNKGVVTVQTGEVIRQNLTSEVTASGEIRPRNYTNILGEGFGRITDIAVKEGQPVHVGDVLLHTDSIQAAADVRAQQAQLAGADAAAQASTAGYQAAVATVAQRQSDLQKAKLDWNRSQSLYTQELISKQQHDADKAAYDSAVAALKAAQAQLNQMRDSSRQAALAVQQANAILAHQQDILRKTTYRAPISGIVSFIPVRVGENVVPGIQNATGSFLMTISDMSVVNAEVMADETDITTLQNGQPATVTVDALPGKTLHGVVTEVGDLAILRGSGQAATQENTANTQEARDFKVLVQLNDPPPSLRPGLSCTAKIQTAHRSNVLTVPIQAVAVRTQEELNQAKHPSGNVTLAATAAELNAEKKEIQGVFVVRGNKVAFVPIKTGITGTTNIEVTDGLKAGDQIVTGSYKVLRTLKPGATIKIDNSLAKNEGT